MNLNNFNISEESIDDITLELNAHYKLYEDTYYFTTTLNIINVNIDIYIN